MSSVNAQEKRISLDQDSDLEIYRVTSVRDLRPVCGTSGNCLSWGGSLQHIYFFFFLIILTVTIFHHVSHAGPPKL